MNIRLSFVGCFLSGLGYLVGKGMGVCMGFRSGREDSEWYDTRPFPWRVCIVKIIDLISKVTSQEVNTPIVRLSIIPCSYELILQKKRSEQNMSHITLIRT